MPTSKLEYLLQRLSKQELDAFRQLFANSTKKREQVLGKLLAMVVKGGIENEEVYAKLYPDKKFSDKQLRNLRSDLFNRLTDFLAVSLFEKSEEKKLFVAKAINLKRATRHFPAMMEKYAKQEKDIQLGLEMADLENRIKAEFLRHEFQVNGRKETSYNSLIVSSEEAFVARTLFFALAHHESQRMYGGGEGELPLVLWESILEKLEHGAWADSVLVQLYFALYKLVKHPEIASHFQSVKSLLTVHGKLVEKSEAQDLYTVALNHCIMKRNGGEKEYIHEIFHLYNEMLDRSILIDENGMDSWLFKSIVSCGVHLKRFDWVRNFMDDYAGYLSPSFRENVLNYCLGMIAFYEGNFPEAETQMNKVLEDYKDPFFGLDARSFLLRIYYETHNETGMDALINSFRLFLRRHQHLSAKRLLNYKEFIRFFRRFIVLGPYKSKGAEKLRMEIEASPHQAGREWFLQKLDLLYPQTKEGEPKGTP